MTLIEAIHRRDAELQKILGSMENKKVFNRILLWIKVWWQDTQRQLLITSPWKPADGDDLPEIDKEVIALIDYAGNGYYKVVFAHRPDPERKVSTNLLTGKKSYIQAKTYDKGGWNIPNVKYWLDVELPKEIEL